MEPPRGGEGQKVDVAYEGNGPLFYRSDLGEWQEVPIDPASRKGEVTAPAGASVLIFSDRKENPVSAIVEIVHNAAGITTTNALDITLGSLRPTGPVSTVYSAAVAPSAPFPTSGVVFVSRGPVMQFEAQ